MNATCSMTEDGGTEGVDATLEQAAADGSGGRSVTILSRIVY